MAIGTVDDFVLQQVEFNEGVTEVLMQETNAFNAASRGCITLEVRGIVGHFGSDAFFKAISGLITRRDPFVTTDVADTPLTMDPVLNVKLNRRIGPIANTMDSFYKILAELGPDYTSQQSEFSFVLGQQVGKAIMADYLNSALGAAAAAIGNVAELTHDYSGTGDMDHAQLVTGQSKMGDAGQNVALWVMHSKTYYDLMAQNIADKIYGVANTTIWDGANPTLGKPTLVTDSPALMTSGTPDTYTTLGLVPGGVRVIESEGRRMVTEVVTGLENLVIRFQGEHAFNVGLMGFGWDDSAGGVNPTDAALTTGANWPQAVTDIKNCAGVAIQTQ